jgi:hypothetical protein
MGRAFVVIAVLMLLCSVSHADVFNLGTGLMNLETVRIGDQGTRRITSHIVLPTLGTTVP